MRSKPSLFWFLAVGGSLALAAAPVQAAPPPQPPPPHEAANYLVPPDPPRDGWRIVPRFALKPVRWVWQLFGAGSSKAVDWLQPVFKQPAPRPSTTATVVESQSGPTGGAILRYESGFGATLGGTAGYHHGPTGAALAAVFGGRYDYGVQLDGHTGHWFALSASYASYDEERFTGALPDGAEMPADGDVRFDQKSIEVTARSPIPIARRFTLAPSVSVYRHRFGLPTELMDAPGFGDDGFEEIYGEMSASYHDLTTAAPWISDAVPSSGWWVRARTGFASDLGGARVRYGRARLEAARLFDLYAGDRVLVLGASTEAVIGDRDDIPYIDLPSLGGGTSLRGYRRGEFRDKIATEATAEYRYGLAPQVTARAFTDVGRTFADAGDLGVDDLRLGFGGGLLIHWRDEVRARVDLAGSIDGDVMLVLVWGGPTP